jgi:hypothetical protein
MWYYVYFFALLFATYFWNRQNEVVAAKEVPFECRFPLSMTAEEVGESAQNVAAGVVEEKTPEGLVVMRFEAPVYHYWSAKAVTYKYLEAVARKYAIVFDARQNYVNIFRELLKNLEAQKTPAVQAAADPLFAAFKTYAPLKPAGLVKNKCNVYKWRGTLKDFLKEQMEKEKEPPPPPMSYAEFKKRS